MVNVFHQLSWINVPKNHLQFLVHHWYAHPIIFNSNQTAFVQKLITDWAVDATALIITSGTCCGQEAQSVNDIRSQIWHWKLLVDGEPDLRRSRLDSNSWIRRTSNSSTADLHMDHQSVLSLASVSSSEGVMSQWFSVVFRQSLYHLYCLPGCR